jgi:hypothetical protein
VITVENEIKFMHMFPIETMFEDIDNLNIKYVDA